MNNIGDNVSSLILRKRRELKMHQSELAELLGSEGIDVTNQAVSKWENGSTTPSAVQFIAICRVLGIKDILGELSGGEEGMFAGLNAKGIAKLGEYAAILRASGMFTAERAKVAQTAPAKLRQLPLYTIPVSAGTGQFLDSDDYEMVEVGDEVPSGANFGVLVAGDSMEPRFHNGQQVWIHQQRSLMTGEIGVFVYDGNAYLKQLVAGETCMKLHSLNPAYGDIVISTELPLRVLGKVVG